MTRSMALLLCLALTFGSVPALAVDDALAPGEIESRIAELEARKSEIELGGPTAGTIIGGVMTGSGLILGIATASKCGSSGDPGAPCSPEEITGLAVTAGVLAIVGIVTLVPSSLKLRERKRERRAIDEEIRSLEAKRVQSALSRLRIGLVPGNGARFTIGWNY